MNTTVIHVEGIGKKYKIGSRQKDSLLRDQITAWMKNPFREFKDSMFEKTDEFWALKDINFKVKEGEVLGIIGKNGAGKSTLLKILSRITTPTEGKAIIKGRVASLLEVGTGFNAELTGRENIYLNGSILGMTRKEIKKKFDSIVDFAGVEKFLDTPVKRYSSGMYVRLAFAIAAHLEPEILIIDEVLAVGDVEFQKKCLGKMDEVAKSGRTVLFVSHNMGAVSSLCDRVIYLENGKIVTSGQTSKVINKYVQSASNSKETPLELIKNRDGSGEFIFTEFSIHNELGEAISNPTFGKPVTFKISIKKNEDYNYRKARVLMLLSNNFGHHITTFDSLQSINGFSELKSQNSIKIEVPKLALTSGTYEVKLILSLDQQVVDRIILPELLVVNDGQYFKTGVMTTLNNYQGAVIDHSWEII